jgi:hypothetical protein
MRSLIPKRSNSSVNFGNTASLLVVPKAITNGLTMRLSKVTIWTRKKIYPTRKSTTHNEAIPTRKELKSKKIAHCKVRIDKDFSLGANLQELYSACIDKIIDSEFFELQD